MQWENCRYALLRTIEHALSGEVQLKTTICLVPGLYISKYANETVELSPASNSHVCFHSILIALRYCYREYLGEGERLVTAKKYIRM